MGRYLQSPASCSWAGDSITGCSPKVTLACELPNDKRLRWARKLTRSHRSLTPGPPGYDLYFNFLFCLKNLYFFIFKLFFASFLLLSYVTMSPKIKNEIFLLFVRISLQRMSKNPHSRCSYRQKGRPGGARVHEEMAARALRDKRQVSNAAASTPPPRLPAAGSSKPAGPFCCAESLHKARAGLVPGTVCACPRLG